MRVRIVFGVILVLTLQGVTFAADEVENMFENPSFEAGMPPWRWSKAATTFADAVVNDDDSVDGRSSALVTVDVRGDWAQFGQNIVSGEQGEEYTFAVLMKSVDGPVRVNLQIERPADPWDRAVRSNDFTIEEDDWQEIYVTFIVAEEFPQGWFAYIECLQDDAQYRADMFQLYEGEYVPFETGDVEKAVSASETSLITTWGELRGKY